MRDIKFRAWDKEEKEMTDFSCLPMYITDIPYAWDRFHFMQYAGLKDANGREIYEGDIIHCIHWFFDGNEVEEPFTASVGFRDGSFTLENINSRYYSDYTGEDNGKGICWIGDINYCEEDYEVIGNIYENPELLDVAVERRVKPEYNGWKLSNIANQRILETENCMYDKIERAVASHVEFLESEYRKAIEHFNVPINEVPNRVKIVRKDYQSEELHIDNVPVLVTYKPEVSGDNPFEYKGSFKCRRLYKEEGE